MAPPAFDRDDDVCLYETWTPAIHPSCYVMQRMAVELVLLQCRFRPGVSFGMLPAELTMRILQHVVVCVVFRRWRDA